EHGSGVAVWRPPVAAPGIELVTVRSEPRVFVLPVGHSLSGRDELRLADVAGLPFVSADLATDGCQPAAWQDDWLIRPRPGGDVPIIGATARAVGGWCEHIVAAAGLTLFPGPAARGPHPPRRRCYPRRVA